jgi:lipopolysaccharide biosynthesis glycosyltransferase
MHYRRMLNFRGGTGSFTDCLPATIERYGWTPEAVAEACRRHDILVPIRSVVRVPGRRTVIPNLEFYGRVHYREHYELALDVARRHSPEIYPFVLATANGSRLAGCNISVMRRDLFAGYVDWLTAVLEKVEAAADLAGLNAYQRRLVGFLAERLSNSYVDYLVARQGAAKRELRIVNGIFGVTPVPEIDAGEAARMARARPRPAAGSGDRIHVAFAIDDAHLPHAAAAILSILAGLHTEQPINIHVLSEGPLPPERQSRLAAALACSPAAQLRFHAVDRSALAGLPFIGAKRGSLARYFPLHLHRLLPDLARVIYLDADVIACANLAELWGFPLGDAAIAGAPDADGFEHSLRLRLGDHLCISPGVLLLDLDRLRQLEQPGRWEEIVRAHGERIVQPVLDLLNLAYEGQVARLPLRWNVSSRLFLLRPVGAGFPSEEAEAARHDPALLHFSGEGKPWRPGSRHPYRHAYWYWRAQTPWPGTGWRRLVSEYGFTGRDAERAVRRLRYRLSGNG